MTTEEKFMFDLEGYLVIKNVLTKDEVTVLNDIADSDSRVVVPEANGFQHGIDQTFGSSTNCWVPRFGPAHSPNPAVLTHHPPVGRDAINPGLARSDAGTRLKLLHGATRGI